MTALRRSAATSAFIFAARLGGAALVFVLQAAIARHWGAAALGDYLLIIAAVNLIAFGMPLGFNVIGSYFAADYAAKAGRQRLSSFLLRAWRNVALAALALLLIHPVFRGLQGETATVLHAVWFPATVLATAMAVVFVNGAVLVGLGSPVAGYAADVVFRPLVMIAGFLIVLSTASSEANVEALIELAAAAYACVALVHTGFAIAAVRRIPASSVPLPDESRRWWRFAPPWIIFALATDFYFDIDLLLLSPMMSREDLAVFGVCARLFALVAFAVSAIYSVATPDIVAAGAKDDPDRFARRITEANLMAAAFAAAAGLGSLILGPFVLSFFGPRFTAGAHPLALMCLGLTIRAMMGPAALALSIHDRPYVGLPAIVLGLAALPIGNLMLVPAYGLMGAGIAAVISMTIWSVALWLTALNCTKVDVSIFPSLKRALRP